MAAFAYGQLWLSLTPDSMLVYFPDRRAWTERTRAARRRLGVASLRDDFAFAWAVKSSMLIGGAAALLAFGQFILVTPNEPAPARGWLRGVL